MLKVDGYDCCIVGVASRIGQDDILVYSKSSMIAKLMVDLEIDFDGAMEFFDHNIGCAYMGEGTPCFIEPYDEEVYHA